MSRVLAVGVFDLFHIGHLRYLQYARGQGSSLLVAVTPDAMSLAVKGKCPVVPEAERLAIVGALACVDEVMLLPVSTSQPEASAEWMSAAGIEKVVAGGCWLGSERWQRLQPLLQARQIEVDYAPHTDGISTSSRIIAIREGV